MRASCRVGIMIGFILLTTAVVAFVRHAATTSFHRRRSKIILQASSGGGDDKSLKGLLDTSSYGFDATKAYGGRKVDYATVKTPKTTSSSSSGSSYDLSTEDSISSSTPSVDDTVTSSLDSTPPPPAPVPVTPSPAPETIKSTAESVTDTIKETFSGTDSSDVTSAASTASPETSIDIQESLSKPFAPLNDFFKTNQESIREAQQQAQQQSTATTAGDVTKSFTNQRTNIEGIVTKKSWGEFRLPSSFQSPTDVGTTTPPGSGKALPLADYVKAKANGIISDDTTTFTQSVVDNAKSKFDLMVANLYDLIGQEKPETLKLPDMQDLSDFTSRVSTLDVNEIQNYIKNLPPDAPWKAVAIGTFLVILVGSQTNRSTNAPSEATVEAASTALGGLTEDLETLQKRMKVLEETGMNLQKELQVARDKLLEKELEISKEKLYFADTKLKASREIDILQRKLKENDGKVKTLDTELTSTRDETERLSKELEKAKTTIQVPESKPSSPEVEELPISSEEESKPPPKKESPAIKSTAEKEAEPTIKESAAKQSSSTEKEAEATTKEELPAAAEPAPKKKVAKKKTATKKAAKKKEDELPTAAVEEEKASKTKSTQKAAPKKAAPKKAIQKSSEEDWSSLSKSTLSRKTVKQLTDYLDAKGVTTTDENGKPLLKVSLVDAVLSK